MLDNDTGTNLFVPAHTDPSHGPLSIAGTGGYRYTPAAGFAGTGSFTYTITDTQQRSSTATVTVTVVPPPAPAATSDAFSTPFETVLTVSAPGVLGNDSGTEISLSDHSDPGHGSVSVHADGSFIYTPDSRYSESDSFTYTIKDAVGQTTTITVVDPAHHDAAPATCFDVARFDVARFDVARLDIGLALATALGLLALGALLVRRGRGRRAH